MKIAHVFLAVASVAAVAAMGWWYKGVSASEGAETKVAALDQRPVANDNDTVSLRQSQLSGLKLAPVGFKDFPIDKQEIGTIGFNQDMLVQVFPPYAGRIITLGRDAGQDVKKGDILFTIDSPDLLQAESSAIAAAGVLQLTTQNLDRQKHLVQTGASTLKDYQQAVSDQQTADGALHAARDALRVFGKSEDDIDHIIARRLADSTLVVRSPIDGRLTTRNASPGLYVQPGMAPAPYSVANIDTMWMNATVAETDSPQFQVGQPVTVSVDAFPGREFVGKVTMIDAMVDANTRRVLVRSEVANLKHELRSGMFASFVIRTHPPTPSVAAPIDSVVREPDGSMTVWVKDQSSRFHRRIVKTGMLRDGYWQILGGLSPGELIAIDGALFLSNSVASAEQ